MSKAVDGEMLSSEWLEILAGFKKLFIGFSGGLDSTVLLHTLALHPSLKQKINAVHVHHGLSPNASDWEYHCLKVCELLNIPCSSFPIHLSNKRNVEESARRARYEVFRTLLGNGDALLLGHHRDDQAETLLLHLMRGAGVDGLAAMPPIKAFAKGSLLRPFLNHSRQRLEEYAAQYQLTWVNDESNLNCELSRNFIRHKVIPLLAEKWPSVVHILARSAEHFQEARDNLEHLAGLNGIEIEGTTLKIPSLMRLNPAQMKNALRVWLKHNQVRLPSSIYFSRLIREVILARADATPMLSWDNYEIRRYQNTLYLLTKNRSIPSAKIWEDWSQPLSFGDYQLIAKPANSGILIPEHSECIVRSRLGGEQFFWHGQTKSLKKLFQIWKIPTWERENTPLLFINGELAAVVGYAINDKFFAQGNHAQIIEINVQREPFNECI